MLHSNIRVFIREEIKQLKDDNLLRIWDNIFTDMDQGFWVLEFYHQSGTKPSI